MPHIRFFVIPRLSPRKNQPEGPNLHWSSGKHIKLLKLPSPEGRLLVSLNFNHLIMLTINFKPVLLGVLGTQEIIIILVIILLLFGGKKIPELMRGLGRGVREFNDAKSNVQKEIEEGMKPKEGDSTGQK
jgi:sec-independent protein translocase protein TatA